MADGDRFEHDLEQFEPVTAEHLDCYNDYLFGLINDRNMEDAVEQITNKGYLLSYLKDFALYTRSEEYQSLKDDPRDAQSLSKPTQAETEFSETGKGEDYYQSFPTLISQDQPDALGLNRFIARHAYLELEFKKHLMSQLQDFHKGFNRFSDKVDSSPITPVDYASFMDMFSTLKETLSVIKDYQADKEAEQARLNAIGLKDTFVKFMVEKKSLKQDSRRQYQISFDFLYEYLGEDYDITQFTVETRANGFKLYRFKP